MAKKISHKAKSAPASGNFSQLHKFFRIASDENRLKILLALQGKVLNVTQIHTRLKLPQNLTSHHISKLKSVDLLIEKSEGTFRNYSVNTKKLKEYEGLFKKTFNI